MLQLVSDIDGTSIGPFTYGVSERRGKWSLTIQSPFGMDESTLSSKLDVSAPPWLAPVRRGWVRMPIHATHGVPSLPELQVVRLEENIAEKISRLTAPRQPAICMTLRGLSPISATLAISIPISSVEWSR